MSNESTLCMYCGQIQTGEHTCPKLQSRADPGSIHDQVLSAFRDQLLIVLIKRMGGEVRIPVCEVDNTGQDMLSFAVEAGPTKIGDAFHFVVSKKS